MSTDNAKRATVTLAALALALVAAPSACGTDAQPPPETQAFPGSSQAQTSEQAIARRLDGLYTASIDGPALRDVRPGLHVPAGMWALLIEIGGRTLRLIPPEGGDITLRLVGVTGSRLRLAPDTACESRAGRTADSWLAWLRTDTFLRLRTIHAPCRSDATVLTSSLWRAVWLTTPLAMTGYPDSP
jgi:hypothetical protein